MRTVALAFLTPIFFIKAGLNVSLPAVYVNLGLVLILFAVKIGTKFLGVYPLSKKYLPDDALYTTLLMSTGLTFGTISAVYGLSAKIINIDQFSILVTVVVASAVIPTIIAKKFEPLHGLLGPILVLLHAGLPFEFMYVELFNAGTAGIFTGLWTREVRNYSGTGATYIFHLWVCCSFQLQYT
jgi:Kef-type K+ transport system membrane component KefB